MDAVERFRAAVNNPAAVELDVAAFCLAAGAHPGTDVDEGCARLDALAETCPEASFDGVRAFLFELLEFAGNTDDYGDPENSLLDSVLDRRLGIPISLSVLMMEVGRRIGVVVHGVGMPGHFLVADAERDGVWCDPFHGGVLYGVEECREVFRRVHGTASQFSRALLQPTPPDAIVARMLSNLERGRLATDPLQLSWMCEMHLALPDVQPAEQQRLQMALRAARSKWN